MHRWIAILLLALVAAPACTTEEPKLPCPPKGIGVEDFDGKSPAEQMSDYKRYDCAQPQICPEVGGKDVLYGIDPQEAAGEVSFLLTNCSTANEKLVIDRVDVYGDERCYFTDVGVADITSTEIPARDRASVRTTYKPSKPGEDHAELRVHSNAQNYPVLRLRVCGLAIVPSTGGAPAPDAGLAGGDGGPAGDSGGPMLVCQAREQQAGCHTK